MNSHFYETHIRNEGSRLTDEFIGKFACASMNSICMTIGGTLVYQPNLLKPMRVVTLCLQLGEGW